MAVAVLIAFLVALAAPVLHRFAGDRTGWLLALVPTALFVYFLLQVPVVAEQGVVMQRIPWLPAMGVYFGFALDGLALLFALLVTAFGALITVYAGSYLQGDPLRGRFFLFLHLFMASMLGVVLADDIIALFAFWELTSFSSYLLIGYKHQYENSRKSALQALLVTGAGGLALLAGLLVMSFAVGGTFSLAEIADNAEILHASPLYIGAFICIVLGCFTKSAQVPFHFWLPNAMAAPSPVSAYLHSATMVKAGVYLLARLYPTLSGTDLWLYTLTIVGGATMVTGAVLALRHSDLKKVLAYTTITALGTLVLLLGLSTVLAIKAAMVFLLTHALYKGALFLVAGSVGHESGTLDVLDLRGLRHKMPWTFGAGVIAALSMAGLPPLFGFIGKETIYEAALALEGGALLVVIAAVFANVLTVVAAAVVTLRPFTGELTDSARRAHEAPAGMLLGPIVLGVAGLLLGIIPWFVGLLPIGPDTIVGPAIAAVLGIPDHGIVLKAWHGFNMALLLSVITLGLGIIGYVKWDPIRRSLVSLDPVWARGPEGVYFAFMDGLLRFADWQTRTIQNGNLRHYMLTLVIATYGLVAVTYTIKVGVVVVPDFDVRISEVVGVLLAATGAIIAAVSNSRVLAVAGLGTAGFGIALLFILFGAPDLAMTQFLVETLIVVVILLVMRRIPALRPYRGSRLAQARDILVAAGVGVIVAVLVFAVLQAPFDTTIPEFFIAESVPGARGRNIVNVVLVDFRAIDTLGEIVVLGIAALGALALLRARRGRRQTPAGEDAL